MNVSHIYAGQQVGLPYWIGLDWLTGKCTVCCW